MGPNTHAIVYPLCSPPTPLCQADLSEEEVPEGFVLSGEIPTAAATKGPAPEGAAAGTAAAAAADSDDDVVFVRDPSAPKRKREEPLSEVAAGKRPKVAVEEDDVIMLDWSQELDMASGKGRDMFYVWGNLLWWISAVKDIDGIF